MPDRHQLSAVLSDLPAAGADRWAPAPATVVEVHDGDQVQVRLGADGSGRGSFAEFQRVTSSDPL
jgi:hypothetical protein